MDLVKKVEKTIRQHGLLLPNDRVIVGVSGGADSMALLHILNDLRRPLGIRLFVAHLNHGLRKAAKGDQLFVKKVSERLNLGFATKTASLARQHTKGSIEEIAREKRLAFLLQTAQKKQCSAIALGHTRDDLAETVLMRIVRGTGLLGIRAILPVRTMEGKRIIRPLLEATRKDIEDFLKKRKIKFLNDATNKETRFFRNKIRRKLIPFLEKDYNSNIKETLANLSKNTALDYEYLEAQAQTFFRRLAQQHDSAVTLELKKLARIDISLQKLLFRLAVKRLQGDLRRLTSRHIDEVYRLIHSKANNTQAHLPNGLRAFKKGKYLILTMKKYLN